MPSYLGRPSFYGVILQFTLKMKDFNSQIVKGEKKEDIKLKYEIWFLNYFICLYQDMLTGWFVVGLFQKQRDSAETM